MREYKDRVREYFSHKKGDVLILSPTNWMVVEKWENMGIPLHIVIQGIDKTFENLRSGGLQQKRVNYLGYCEPEILNLWKEYRKKSHAESGHTELCHAEPGHAGSGLVGSVHTGLGKAGAGAYRCTDVQAAYVTQDAQSGMNHAQEQKKIREYVDQKISLLIMQITQLMEKCEKDKSSREPDGDTSDPADTKEPPEYTMMGLLQRTVRAIRLEEELIHLRKETQTGPCVDIEHIEKRLQKLDGQLLQSLFAGLCSDKRDALLSSAEKQTRRYKNQMERAAYQETIQAYSIELLRRELGIRQLSLYQ